MSAQAERNARVDADWRLERIWALGRLAVDPARAERIRAAMAQHPECVQHAPYRDRPCQVCRRLRPAALKSYDHTIRKLVERKA